MLNTAGLSLDQAPPISVPFGFFVVAPLFAVAAGLLVATQGEVIFASRWTPAAIAATHLLTLGFLAQVMCGALFQMLPVLAGSPVPFATIAGRLTQAGLITGTLALSLGFYGAGPQWMLIGAGLLAVALTLFAAVVGYALVKAQGARYTVRAMQAALVGLIVTFLLGVMLAVLLAKGSVLAGFSDWVDLHLAWGLLGWAGILIMGVGYQVVPMFHVTPSFPNWMMRFGAPSVLLGLLIALALTVTHQAHWLPAAFSVSILGFLAFALIAVERQRRRERPRIDATLLYWWSAMASALAAGVLWVLGARSELIGVLLLVGVGMGLPSGMLFKIVPFLSWFHLQRRQIDAKRFDVRVPHMQVFVPDLHARLQFSIYLFALVALIAAAAWPSLGLAPAAGVGLALAAVVLQGLLVASVLRYRRCGQLIATPRAS